jgi:hypothetical protein
MLEGSGALALRQFGYEQAEVLSYQFCRGVAKHLLGRRVDCLDAATTGLQGDDAVHHGLENRLDQRRAVAQGLLRSILLGDITEYQHGTEDLPVPVADWCATVGDCPLATVARYQYGVVGQALFGAMRQGFHDGDRRGLAGFLVDDVKHFFHRTTRGFRL